MTCPHGDETCPCPDGDECHYEGEDPWPCPKTGRVGGDCSCREVATVNKLEQVRNRNHGLMEELAREGGALNPVWVQTEFIAHLVETLIGPVDSEAHQAFTLAFEVRVGAGVEAEIARRRHERLQVAVMPEATVTDLKLGGRVRDKRAAHVG